MMAEDARSIPPLHDPSGLPPKALNAPSKTPLLLRFGTPEYVTEHAQLSPSVSVIYRLIVVVLA